MLSDMEGRYRFPALPIDIARASGYRVAIRHIRYRPAEVKDLAAGARVSAPQTGHLAAGESFALLASSRILSQDVRLEPGPTAAQMAAASARDPNLAEYYYQQALLLLGQNKPKEAVELLKVYAQTGANPSQVSRALVLVSQNDGK